jgi:aminomethyltransferase
VTIQRTPPSLVSGLRPIDRSFETWWVRPGSATVVELHGGDRVTVIDPDGGQPAELTVLSPDGLDDAGALGARADAPATVLRELVASGADDGFLGVLHARGLRPHDAMAVRLFGPDGAPGASQAFACERDALIVVAAPGGRVVDGDPPASALVVEVKRDTPRAEGDGEVPEPLAEPRLDFRVDHASALSYEVREGE